MAGTSSQDAAAANAEPATPYKQEFLTEMQKEMTYNEEIPGSGIGLRANQPAYCAWGRVPFELKLSKYNDSHDTGQLTLKLSCNKKAPDPFWRCSFNLTIEHDVHEVTETIQHTFTAHRREYSFDIHIIRVTPENLQSILDARFWIKIKVTSWAGCYPALVKSFTEKTDVSDATLIVEGRRLYVSRAILALQSTFFYRLFYDKRFSDWEKEEFDLPTVSFADMLMFLYLVYPNTMDGQPNLITSIDTIEAMLKLAEFFESDTVTRLMEKYLISEEFMNNIEGFSDTRSLVLADRFRLSAVCSRLMTKLKNDHNLNTLTRCEEYSLLSDSLCRAIMDMRVRAGKPALPPPPPPAPPTAQALPEIPAAAAAAAAARMSWSDFQADVARVLAASANYALTSVLQLADLKQTLHYLQSMGQEDYNAHVNPLIRQLLHEIDIASGRQEAQDWLVNAVGTFIGRVGQLQTCRAAAAAAAMADSPASPDAASASAAAAADGTSWVQFVADVGTLRETADFPHSVVRPSVLYDALGVLLYLREETFNGVSLADRAATHGSIVQLMRLTGKHHRSQGYVKDLIVPLVRLAEGLRNEDSPPLTTSPLKRRRRSPE